MDVRGRVARPCAVRRLPVRGAAGASRLRLPPHNPCPLPVVRRGPSRPPHPAARLRRRRGTSRAGHPGRLHAHRRWHVAAECHDWPRAARSRLLNHPRGSPGVSAFAAARGLKPTRSISGAGSTRPCAGLRLQPGGILTVLRAVGHGMAAQPRRFDAAGAVWRTECDSPWCYR